MKKRHAKERRSGIEELGLSPSRLAGLIELVESGGVGRGPAEKEILPRMLDAIAPRIDVRLEAIDSLEDLGSGFTLATHDLEIRGAGELLGDEQSGQIQEIGFSLYTELLGRAVESLRAMSEHARTRDMKLVFEATNHLEMGKFVNTASNHKRVIELTGVDNIGIQLDFFHVNLEELGYFLGNELTWGHDETWLASAVLT